MIVRESDLFFNCEYDQRYRNVRLAFLSEMRTAVKRREAIDSGLTLLCGCCKRPLKISGSREGGKVCFHFRHIHTPEKGECDYYEGPHLSADEIKAMLFNGRTEGPRHKLIKAKIASVLQAEPDIENVAVEEVVKKVGKTWRRPDIRADFSDKTVVFEVQLSAIFHNVILERNDAYQKSGRYICWIFEDVNEENPIMREVDAWSNNNYNLFGFDSAARAATESTGRLHLTVKYYAFSVIENGVHSELGGRWHTKTVKFSDLTFDSRRMMVYLHDSMAEREKCNDQIDAIVARCKAKAIEEERRHREEEALRAERADAIYYICNMPYDVFPPEKYRLIMEHIDHFTDGTVEMMLSHIRESMIRFDAGALNRWLRIACEIVKRRNTGRTTATYLWNEAKSMFRKDGTRFGLLSLYDYFAVSGLADYPTVMNMLLRPIDEATSEYIGNITTENKDFADCAPLLLLNRYYRTSGNPPRRIVEFLLEKIEKIWCLISAQTGKVFGYTRLQNLKQVTNIVCNNYGDIARLYLYLIDRNGFASQISATNYGRLKKVAESIDVDSITIEDLETLLPKRPPSDSPSGDVRVRSPISVKPGVAYIEMDFSL